MISKNEVSMRVFPQQTLCFGLDQVIDSIILV